MIITVASFKGGVGKTTSAVHLAACLNRQAPTMLLDGDVNANALAWAEAGRLPFPVFDVEAAPDDAGERFTHTVFDTGGGLKPDELGTLAAGCDLLVIPASPGTLDTHTLTRTLGVLRELPQASYRVLLTRVPPPPRTDGAQLRAALAGLGIPLFAAEVPALVAYEKAAASGQIAAEVDDRNARRAWAAYEAVSNEVLHG